MPPKTSDDLRKRVIELAKQGKTRNAIREETGLALDTIRSILSEAGVVPLSTSRYRKPKAPNDALVEKVLRLHMEGVSMSVINAVTGLTNAQIAKIVRESPEYQDGDAEDVGPRDFIHAWQTSDSLDEVSLKLRGMPLSRIKARAAMYRGRGVPLKNYRRGARYNWNDLSDFAESLLEEGEDDE